MPLFLTQRDTELTERMDDPQCDYDALLNTYRQFRVINGLISRWSTIYRTRILPYAQHKRTSVSLLDIGFGGGDIPRKLATWAGEDGIGLTIIGIETDERAFAFVQDQSFPPSVRFRLASSSDLVDEGKVFDFVISNHLLHHLDRQEFHSVLEQGRILSRHMVLFNDIERSDLGYLLFNLITRPVFRSSFITQDGLTSIKRSYTYGELAAAAPEGWEVTRLFPYRLLLSYLHG